MKIKGNRLVVLLMAIFVAASLLGGCGGAQPSASADYPKGPIKLIIPTTAGGGYDLGARLVGRYLPKYLPKKVDIVPENQSGAGQMIAVHNIYAAAPDGYTIGAFNAVGALMAQFVRPEEVKFDMSKFVVLGLWQQDVRAIGVSNDFDVKSWTDLVAKSQEKPVLCGTGGAGSGQHTDPMMLEAVSNLKLKYVHYDGSAQVEPAMGRKEIQMEVAQVSTVQTLVTQKLGRPLLVFSEQRNPNAPDVPTAVEAGMPKDAFTKLMEIPYFGVDRIIVAPPKTDPAIAEMLRTAMWKVFQDPEYVAEVKKMQGENNPMQGKDYESLLAKKIKAAQDNKELISKLKF